MRQKFNELKSKLDKKVGQLQLLQKQMQHAENRKGDLLSAIDLYEKVMKLLQLASEFSRERMKGTIENIVTNALQVVFGSDMKFLIELGSRGGSPAAEFFVTTPEGLSINPMDAKGGGVIDVISTTLRLAVLELYQPKIKGPIILDEVGKHISAEFSENFAYFLKEYGARVGRQIILVTHNQALSAAADKSFKVSIKTGISEVATI